MSELAKDARAKMKAKAERLATADPHQKVDASSWTPGEAMDADVKTGMRPVSRRQFKRGGKVEGEGAKHRADRAPRKKGGVVNAFVNRNDREANEEREGVKHVGGFKDGGRPKRAMGGPLADPISNAGRLGSFNYRPGGAGVLKTGGRAKRASGGLLGAGLGLIPQLVIDGVGGDDDNKPAPYAPGAPGKKNGGKAITSGMRPEGGREPRRDGGKLDAKARAALPKSEFGEPGSRKYPMPDKGHAANAKARASQAEHAGRMSKSTEQKIDAKADRVLARASGGRAKGKTNINIVIAPGHAQAPQPMAAPAGPPPAPPAAAGVPMPPPQRPPMMGGAMPMPVPVPMLTGAAAAAGGQPPMMRKRGGRTGYPIDTGSGGGEGRLQKLRAYGAKAKDAGDAY